MNVSEKDASEALDAIETAGQRVREIKRYREASQFLILWGVIWIVANSVTDLMPRYARSTWLGCEIAGYLITIWLVILQAKRIARQYALTPSQRALYRRRGIMIGITILCFFPVVTNVIAPISGKQQNAFISLFWAFAFMASGAWLGWRMFITGLVTVTAILVGYLLLHEHYFLWMAAFGGGSLLVGGLWLRKI